MLKNRASPKRPFIAALLLATSSMLYALGYRGKYQLDAAPMNFADGALLFGVVFLIAFPACYVLRFLGVHIGRWGGKEEDADTNSGT